MRFTERDRRELINKLKKIKDPRERDRVLWVLAGQEEDVFRSTHLTATPSRLEPVRQKTERPASSKAPEPRDMPEINIDAKRMLGLVVPAFFILFGLIRIGQAAMNYIASQDIEAEISGLITGGIFLIIGLAGVFRAVRPPPVKRDGAS